MHQLEVLHVVARVVVLVQNLESPPSLSELKLAAS